MPVIKQCERCKREYKIKQSAAAESRYCSRQCAHPILKIEKTCVWCNKLYLVVRAKGSSSRYCSRACQNIYQSRERAEHTKEARVKKICETCRMAYETLPCLIERSKFCSKKCKESYPYPRSNKIQTSKFCERCGAAYLVSLKRAARSRFCGRNCPRLGRIEKSCESCGSGYQVEIHRAEFTRYCSRNCHNRANSYRRIEKTKAARIQKKCEHCGSHKELPPCFAKTFRFCSKKCRADWESINRRGANNPQWNGGTSDARKLLNSSREYKEWRRLVYKRDSYTCQHCGDNRGGNLHAHHIKPVAIHPELALEIQNGLTLCNPCHTKLHQQTLSLSGKSRLKEYLQEKQLCR